MDQIIMCESVAESLKNPSTLSPHPAFTKLYYLQKYIACAPKQLVDGRASSYYLWYTLSLSPLHFLPQFIRAVWRYTLNVCSQPKSRLPMPCSHACRTNGNHTRTSNARAFACRTKMWPTSSRYQAFPLSPGGIRACPSELCSTNSKAPMTNRTP
jgi:hypothetical protein